MLSCCEIIRCLFVIIFCKHKTAYEMRISDWSSDVCSSDLLCAADEGAALIPPYRRPGESRRRKVRKSPAGSLRRGLLCPPGRPGLRRAVRQCGEEQDRHDIGDLDHRVDGRSRGVLVRIAYGVAGHRGLMGFAALAAVVAVFDIFLGVIPDRKSTRLNSS